MPNSDSSRIAIRRLSLHLISAVCVVTGAARALGATPQLEEMVVTAHRTDIALENAGSAVSVIDRPFIEHRQALLLGDVLRSLPGISVSRTAGFGSQTQVRARGAEANHVLVVIDGVEANDPAGADEFDFASLTSYDVERVELVRGPQSALWGSDATAAVLSITTRRGSEPIEAEANLQSGARGTRSAAGHLARNTGTASVDFSASRISVEGDSAAASGSERDGYDNATLGLRARWEPATDTHVGISARQVDATTEIDDIDFGTGLPADADRESKDAFALLRADAGTTLLDGRWDNDLGITRFESQRRQIADGVRETTTRAQRDGLYYQATVHLDGPAERARHQLIIAVDHERSTFRQRGDASAFGDPNQDQSMGNTGYVVQYLGEPVADWHLSAGARYDDASDFDNIATWRLTSAYRLAESATTLHASFGSGQKAPTFVERFGYFADQFLGNPDLRPERSTGYDVGVRQVLFDGGAQFDLTLFHERLENEIDGFVFDPDSGRFTAANVDGSSRRTGAELALWARLPAAVDASISYTYVNAREPAAAGGHSRELRRPRHTASLDLNRAFLGERGNLNVNLYYNGAQLDRYFPPPLYGPERVRLDDYLLLDLSASLALSANVSLFARVENLLDERYANVLGYRGAGRGAYAGVRVRTAR
ncbi:MAG: TonB-dependent receptor [Pseudomonadales bacterium]